MAVSLGFGLGIGIQFGQRGGLTFRAGQAETCIALIDLFRFHCTDT